jgi:hypothetical protein
MREVVAAEITRRAESRGGFVNSHAHLDIAYILEDPQLDSLVHELGLASPLETGELPLSTKMEVLDLAVRTSPEFMARLPERIDRLLRDQRAQGCVALRGCVTIDPLMVGDVLGVLDQARAPYRDVMPVQLVALHARPLGEPDVEARFRSLCSDSRIDVVGGLPQLEAQRPAAYINQLIEIATVVDKPLEIHVDEYLSVDETDTEILAECVIAARVRGFESRVAAVHAVTLASRERSYRRHVIELLREAAIDVVVCPRAAISMRNLDAPTALHNSVAPVRELIDGGVNVALGTDNVGDMFCPLSDGNLLTELEILAEATRLYQPAVLAQIASDNGRRVLGLAPPERDI